VSSTVETNETAGMPAMQQKGSLQQQQTHGSLQQLGCKQHKRLRQQQERLQPTGIVNIRVAAARAGGMTKPTAAKTSGNSRIGSDSRDG
jgi:hypothetical protein